MNTTRLRIRFTKEGDLRLISHRDLVRTLERLFRRADLPLAMSEGYHPKPRMMLPSALALGISGCQEVMEVQLAEDLSSDEVRRRLAAHAPPEMEILSVETLPPGTPKSRVASAMYQIHAPPERRAQLQAAIDELMAQPSYCIERTGGKKTLDLKADLMELALHGETLQFRLRVRQEGSIRAREVLEALGAADLDELGHPLARTQLELAS